MRGVNRVMLIGNLGRDPDVQYLEGNIAVAKFPLATTETFKDRAGKLISQTEWHTVVLWRGLAELAQKYLHKGSLVYIEGRLRTRSWEDKDGNKKFATEVVGDNLIMLDKRTDTLNHGPASHHGPITSGDNPEGYSVDIPPPLNEPSQDLPF
ncbi:MAG: single-stranded DNA-binding protein [Chitinophagaceae bacterium]